MKALTSNWHIMRIIRLILAIAIMVQSWYMKDTTTAVFSIVLLATAAFNIGCCGGPASCSTNFSASKKSSEKNTEYEEVV
jgi:hypothetical protein